MKEEEKGGNRWRYEKNIYFEFKQALASGFNDCDKREELLLFT
jgi:hypothetical protein